MAKKDFRQDTEDIFGLDQATLEITQKEKAPSAMPKETKAEKGPENQRRPVTEKAASVPKKTAVVKSARAKPDEKAAKKASVESLTLKSYYITPRLYKAMKLRAAMSDLPEEKDLSAIVRAALTAYLEEELARL